MANPEHLAILKQGVEQWNKWRRARLEAFAEAHFDLSDADISGAILRRANLSGVNLNRANLSNADLGQADLIGADLWMSNLTDANLAGANLTETDASDAKLSGASLHEANLYRAILRATDLSNADLRRANLHRTNLRGASFSEADLWSADFSGANLRYANLLRADLREANLRTADLRGADLSEGWTGGTHFADVDLSAAKGLETIVHDGPSSIGIDTLYRSQGKIPDVFLRGCGLQDWEIEMVKLYRTDLPAHDLTTSLYRVSELRSGVPVRYSSCFISYSTKDQEFAERLYADLQNKGVRCWFAPHDIKGGRKLHEQLDEAIRMHDKLLLILSEASMDSDWVKTEILKARKREMEENKRKDPLNREARLSGAPADMDENTRPTLSSEGDDKGGYTCDLSRGCPFGWNRRSWL